MAPIRTPLSYDPLPRQEAFHKSQADWKFYGGALGGGKSRALCEEAFQAALDYPGIEIIIARNEHTAIVDSTRKTMELEVIPGELWPYCRQVKSGGFDFIEFPNRSKVHFVGLNDPKKFLSREIGLLVLDEASEIEESALQILVPRLRQKCQACAESRARGCDHLPHRVLCGSNPDNPGHWLYRYFVLGADKTEYGYYKHELRVDEDADSIGSAEFVVARATDNPFLAESYVKRQLRGLKKNERRRYLDGEWFHISGSCFFEVDSLEDYTHTEPALIHRMDFEPRGIGDRAALRKHKMGKVRVYGEPRSSRTYAIGADVATGRGTDYSCAYVVDLHDMGLAAEFHGKLDADEFAEQLHFLGKYYGRASGCENDALLAVESAGGWGEPVVISLRDGKGGRPPYSRLYRHTLDAQVDLPLTKRYGYPINTKTRPQVLNQLERAIREKSLPWMTDHLIKECLTFCEFEEGTPSPRAQPGCHDDAVMAAAITLELYRQRGLHPDREARVNIKKKQRRLPKIKKTLPRGKDISPWKQGRKRV